jgi:hypothetical protein
VRSDYRIEECSRVIIFFSVYAGYRAINYSTNSTAANSGACKRTP